MIKCVKHGKTQENEKKREKKMNNYNMSDGNSKKKKKKHDQENKIRNTLIYTKISVVIS